MLDNCSGIKISRMNLNKNYKYEAFILTNV